VAGRPGGGDSGETSTPHVMGIAITSMEKTGTSRKSVPGAWSRIPSAVTPSGADRESPGPGGNPRLANAPSRRYDRVTRSGGEMGTRSARGMLGPLDWLLRHGTAAGMSDGQLLERYLGRHDEAAEAAFGALVDRHGLMVMAVCRKALRDHHDAQDPFQATFLVLARRASSNSSSRTMERAGPVRFVRRRRRVKRSRATTCVSRWSSFFPMTIITSRAVTPAPSLAPISISRKERVASPARGRE
jgi:hypothetical protein